MSPSGYGAQVVDGQEAVEPELGREDETRVREDQVVETERQVEWLTSLLRPAQRPADDVAGEREPAAMHGGKRLRHSSRCRSRRLRPRSG